MRFIVFILMTALTPFADALDFPKHTVILSMVSENKYETEIYVVAKAEHGWFCSTANNAYFPTTENPIKELDLSKIRNATEFDKCHSVVLSGEDKKIIKSCQEDETVTAIYQQIMNNCKTIL